MRERVCATERKEPQCHAGKAIRPNSNHAQCVRGVSRAVNEFTKSVQVLVLDEHGERELVGGTNDAVAGLPRQEGGKGKSKQPFKQSNQRSTKSRVSAH